MKRFPLQQLNDLVRDDQGVWRLEQHREFSYSEGEEAEAYLRTCFSTCTDLSSASEELQERIRDWSSEYHLGAERANLLRPLRLEAGGKVLELGCGCGTLTRYLGEQGLQVEAVEGSRSRASLAALRCRDLDQVQVICANYNDLTLPREQYAAILLIGVLEYAPRFSGGSGGAEEAVLAILAGLQRALRPDGVLCIALENRLGLKYWLGAGEDHYIEPDIGLYGYPGRKGVRTFDRREWEDLIAASGLQARFLYPFPDYKLPRVLLSDEFVRNEPHAASLLYRIVSRDPCTEWQARDDEFLRWLGLHRSGYLPDFANSFLILLSSSGERLGQVAPFDFVHFSSRSRKTAFRTVTEKPAGQDRVEKRLLLSDTEEVPAGIRQELQAGVYHRGRLLVEAWLDDCCRQDRGQAYRLQLEKYFSFLQTQAVDCDPATLVDLMPSNIVISSQGWQVIDQEWVSGKTIDIQFILFRSLLWFGYHNRTVLGRFFSAQTGLRTVADFVVWSFSALQLGLRERLEEFLALEEALHREIATGPLAARVLWEAPLADDDRPGERPEQQEPAASAPEGSGDGPQPFTVPDSPWDRFSLVLKRRLKTCRSLVLDSHYRAVHRSGLFDSRFYLELDPDLDPRYVDPLLHYIQTGWQEGRNPNGIFDAAWYREQYAGARDGDPLLHYIEQGWRQGNDPSPLFWTGWYMEQYPEWKKKANPLAHYLHLGWASGCRPLPFFDSAYYLRCHADRIPAGMNPLVHYLHHGLEEAFDETGLFDPAYYLEDNPSLFRIRIPPLLHYLRFGAREGRSPNRLFDPAWYAERHAIGAEPPHAPFLHYYTTGCREDLRPWKLFDPVFYRQQYPDCGEGRLPLVHYLQEGIGKGYYPCREVADLERKPLVSVIVPLYNTDGRLLRRCIHSVLYQAYPHWELCLVDDGSSREEVRKIVEEYGRRDQRIRYRFLEYNQGISAASNEAVALARGEYLAFLDHDDELTLDALYVVVRAINDHDPDLLYSDEALVDLESRIQDRFYKPDFNAELLLSHNYITHLVVVRRELFLQVGGFSREYDGAQDFDLLLKLSEQCTAIHHVPSILYHWRAHGTSTSINHTQKDYADEAGRKALEAAVFRRTIQATVHGATWKYYYRVRRRLAGRPTVSLLLRFQDPAQVRSWYARRQAMLGYPELEILCAVPAGEEGGEEEPLAGQVRLVGVRDGQPAAAVYNLLVSRAGGEHLLFLDPGLEPEHGDWIEALLEYSCQQEVGTVSGQVPLAPGMEESFFLPACGEPDWKLYRECFVFASRHLNGLQCPQNVVANSIALFMVRRRLFTRLNGFADQEGGRFFFDLDFCLLLRREGLENIFTPYCRVTGTRSPYPEDGSSGRQELLWFQKKWQRELCKGDPYYNPGRLFQERGVRPDQWLAWYAGSG